ncbi:MBL fold metallo-hydrolase [Paenibacillus sp. SAF-068]|uniref:MBL fold metallo-hydrolase n=1 Tax=Paenibacillus sp. SAF-068 TaxID=3436864 RepID=UPI003F7D8EE5
MGVNVCIEMFPSSYGDSFLINYGDKYQNHIIVDFGFSSTYYKFLKKRLQLINENNERLALAVFTHIDSDHINGAIPFLKENESSASPKIIGVDEIWHNSLLNSSDDELFPADESDLKDKLRSILALGYPQDEEEMILSKPIGVVQGSAVCDLLLKGGYNWNKSFGNKAVVVSKHSKDLPIVQIDEDVTITILTPTTDKLTMLKKIWKSKLFELGIEKKGNNMIFSEAFEYWIAQKAASDMDSDRVRPISQNDGIKHLIENSFIEDTAIANGSSISFVLSFKEKSILFLGDAHPSDVEQSLKKYSESKKIYFSAIKVSHHGGSGSMSPALLELVDAKYYIFSTNGFKYNHPSKETIARIIARPISNDVRVLVFNYKTDSSKFYENMDYQNEYKYEIEYGNSLNTLINI